LDREDYLAWREKKDKARLASSNREEEIAAVDEEIEIGLVLIGSTAIEDKL